MTDVYLPENGAGHTGSLAALAVFLGSSRAVGHIVTVCGEGFCGLEAAHLGSKYSVRARVDCSVRVETRTAHEAWEETLSPTPAPPLVASSPPPCDTGCKECASFSWPKPSPSPPELPSGDSLAARRMRAFHEVEVLDPSNLMAIVGPEALDPHIMFAPCVIFYLKRPGRDVSPCLLIQPLLMVPRCPGSEVRYAVWAEDKELAAAVRARCGESRVSEALW